MGEKRRGDSTAVAGMTPFLRAATPARAVEQFKRLYGSEKGGCIRISLLSEAT